MILIISSDHVPHIGGKSTHIMDLMEGIKSNKEDVLLFSQAQYPKTIKTFIKLMLSPFRLYSINYFQYVYSKIWRVLLRERTLKLYQRYKPTCISCQDAFAAASLKPIRKRIKCPIVLTMHTYFGLENGLDSKKSKIQKKIYVKNLKNELIALEVVDRVVAVDNRILSHVMETINREKKIKKVRVSNCTAIENFTNTETFVPGNQDEKYKIRIKYGIDKNCFVIICARRLVEKNGVINAVDAMKYVNKNIKLVIAGDGPQLPAIEECIKSEKLQSKIMMLGSVNPKNIIDLYKMADCSIVPSITVNGLQEATSISALEAMSCGLPTIASSIGGLVQLIKDDVNGCLVDEGNSVQIAKKLTKLVEDKNYYQELSKNARQFVVDKHSHIQGAKLYLREFNAKK